MSGAAQQQAPTEAPAAGGAGDWLVRPAVPADAAAVAHAVGRLLAELGAGAPAPDALLAACDELLADPAAGAVVVAEADGRLVGVLAASIQLAMHVPGRYALIQDLWVDPAWRSRSIGAELVGALAQVARERGLARIEVGLPKPSFPALAATQAFYRACGFEDLGPRMRALVA
jgi:GNAT superfamily N-acetyltransferase